MKGPNLFRGYWNKPRPPPRRSWTAGWRTGDLGRIDDEGFLYIEDRAKDMVLRGGENVYCAEVESAIYEHPDVYEAAVFGVPDERLGEEVATVITRPDRDRPSTPTSLGAFSPGSFRPSRSRAGSSSARSECRGILGQDPQARTPRHVLRFRGVGRCNSVRIRFGFPPAVPTTSRCPTRAVGELKAAVAPGMRPFPSRLRPPLKNFRN